MDGIFQADKDSLADAPNRSCVRFVPVAKKVGSPTVDDFDNTEDRYYIVAPKTIDGGFLSLMPCIKPNKIYVFRVALPKQNKPARPKSNQTNVASAPLVVTCVEAHPD